MDEKFHKLIMLAQFWEEAWYGSDTGFFLNTEDEIREVVKQIPKDAFEEWIKNNPKYDWLNRYCPANSPGSGQVTPP